MAKRLYAQRVFLRCRHGRFAAWQGPAVVEKRSSDETRLSPNDCECEQNIALKDDVFSRLDAWVQLLPTGS